MECCLQQLVVRVWCSRCYGWREDFLVLRESEGCCWLLALLSRHMCLLERWYGCWDGLGNCEIGDGIGGGSEGSISVYLVCKAADRDVGYTFREFLPGGDVIW